MKFRSVDFDVVLNFCEGMSSFDEPGLNVIQTLEKYNLAYTGAGPDFYEPSRITMKELCAQSKVKSPKGVLVFDINSLEDCVKALAYPMIVKHHNGYGSIGLLKESKVENFEQLKIQVERMLGLFEGVLIEEYIEGREFIVLVSENPDKEKAPVVYEPLEAVFSGDDHFKYEKLKWEECWRFKYDGVGDKKLSDKLKRTSKKVFLAMNGSGYGRCDIRMAQNGDLYLLEINPNSGIMFPLIDPGDDDLILQRDPRGYKTFFDLLFRSALKRQRLMLEQAQAELNTSVSANSFSQAQILQS